MKKTLNQTIASYRQNPSKTVFVRNNQNISAQQFLADIDALVNLWVGKLSSSQKIALAIEDSYLFACAWIACQFLNKTTILLPNNKSGTQKNLSKHYDTIVFDTDIHLVNKATNNLEITNPTTVFFTSGSTGEHLPCSKTLENIENESNSLNTQLVKFDIKNTQRVYASVSHQHLYGFSCFFIWSLFFGKTIHSERLFIPQLVHEKLTTKDIIFITTPVIISYLDGRSDGVKKSLLISSASELKHCTAVVFNSLHSLPVMEIYGSTETGIIAHRQQIKNPQWQTFDNVKIRSNTNNQLLVQSSFFNQNDELMSDTVEMVNSNSFILKGRIDRVIKIAGKRISLSEIERLLLEHEWVQDVACVPKKTYREFIGALICLSAKGQNELRVLGKQKLTQQLKVYLLEYLDIVTLPKQWRFVDKIPTNTQGKKVLELIQKEFES